MRTFLSLVFFFFIFLPPSRSLRDVLFESKKRRMLLSRGEKLVPEKIKEKKNVEELT